MSCSCEKAAEVVAAGVTRIKPTVQIEPSAVLLQPIIRIMTMRQPMCRSTNPLCLKSLSVALRMVAVSVAALITTLDMRRALLTRVRCKLLSRVPELQVPIAVVRKRLSPVVVP